MKYYILESIDNDSINKRVIEAKNAGEAYKLWLDNPSRRAITKEVDLEVIEK